MTCPRYLAPFKRSSSEAQNWNCLIAHICILNFKLAFKIHCTIHVYYKYEVGKSGIPLSDLVALCWSLLFEQKCQLYFTLLYKKVSEFNFKGQVPAVDKCNSEKHISDHSEVCNHENYYHWVKLVSMMVTGRWSLCYSAVIYIIMGSRFHQHLLFAQCLLL